MNEFETDYLIIGAGAVGLAFADTLGDLNPVEYLVAKKQVENSSNAWTQLGDTYMVCVH